MGVEKVHRGLRVDGALTVTGAVGSTAATTLDGITNTGSAVVAAETLTSTQAGSTLSGNGVSFITSGATAGTNIFNLPTPVAGQVKHLAVSVGTTDAVDVLNSATTTRTFYGATGNALRFSTGTNKIRGVTLVAKSTTQWAVIGGSTGISILGSTGH